MSDIKHRTQAEIARQYGLAKIQCGMLEQSVIGSRTSLVIESVRSSVH